MNIPDLGIRDTQKGVRAMYTDYGYSKDGVEYATVDEAEEPPERPDRTSDDTE